MTHSINNSNHQHQKTSNPIETHPFPAVLPAHADILMMGTFPPTQDKWAMQFHYPNFYNDMWRVYGQVFFGDKDYFRPINEDGSLASCFEPQRIIEFLNERGIASCPTVRKAIREEGNASDKHLTVVEAVNLQDVLNKLPKVTDIFTTGGKATEILIGLYNQKLTEDMTNDVSHISTELQDKQHKTKQRQTKQKKIKLPRTNQSIDFAFADRTLTLHRLPSTSRAYPLSLEKKIQAYQDFFKKMDKL